MLWLNNPVTPCLLSGGHRHGEFLHLCLMGLCICDAGSRETIVYINTAHGWNSKSFPKVVQRCCLTQHTQQTSFWGGWVQFAAVEESYWVMEIFYILTEMWITWVHAFIKTYLIVQLLDKNLCICMQIMPQFLKNVRLSLTLLLEKIS